MSAHSFTADKLENCGTRFSQQEAPKSLIMLAVEPRGKRSEFSRRVFKMSKHRLLLLLCLATAALGSACSPKIGDGCNQRLDCSRTQQDRLCDNSAPGGYCTVYDCTPGSCPDEANCVAFNQWPASTQQCNDWARSGADIGRFCMRRCEDDSDCRDGYSCIDVDVWLNPYAASNLDPDRGPGKVCWVAYTGPALDPNRESDVCIKLPSVPADAGAPSGDGG